MPSGARYWSLGCGCPKCLIKGQVCSWLPSFFSVTSVIFALNSCTHKWRPRLEQHLQRRVMTNNNRGTKTSDPRIHRICQVFETFQIFSTLSISLNSDNVLSSFPQKAPHDTALGDLSSLFCLLPQVPVPPPSRAIGNLSYFRTIPHADLSLSLFTSVHSGSSVILQGQVDGFLLHQSFPWAFLTVPHSSLTMIHQGHPL